MSLDPDHCYGAVVARDSRFDGWFVTAVRTTGIYCRPSCPARTPARANVRFYATAAAAQSAGYRACRRCRPDAAPGSPQWDARGDVAARAMRLIADGLVDREGVSGLARRLGFSERHLHRVLCEALGAGPIALARAQRARSARLLLETTDLGVAAVALAAGFGSVRQFNDTVRELFGVTPTDLRRARRAAAPVAAGALTVRLAHRAPLDVGALIGHFAARAIAGVEQAGNGWFRRSLSLPHGGAVVTLHAGDGIVATIDLDDLRDLATAVERCRRMLDLDADPAAVLERLGSDRTIGGLVRADPGRRVPGHVDGAELAVRAVLGQQISVAAAAALGARLAAAHGEPLERPQGAVTHRFPSPARLAAADPAALPMPRRRAQTLVRLAAELDAGEIVLDAGADREHSQRRLLALPGVGPWTVAYVAMRALRDPDAFPAGDLGVRRALTALGADGRAAAAVRLAERWRPYRAYATQHLWASLSSDVSTERIAA